MNENQSIISKSISQEGYVLAVGESTVAYLHAKDDEHHL